VAYALRTRARVQLADMPMRSHRVITPITIRNDGQEALLVDRLNLPVPFLSIYTAPDGYLWTESVTLVQSQDSEFASAVVGKDAPREIKGAPRLSPPRQITDTHLLVRAFTSLFSPFEQED
jgi:hypothetical protein